MTSIECAGVGKPGGRGLPPLQFQQPSGHCQTILCMVSLVLLMGCGPNAQDIQYRQLVAQDSERFVPQDEAQADSEVAAAQAVQAAPARAKAAAEAARAQAEQARRDTPKLAIARTEGNTCQGYARAMYILAVARDNGESTAEAFRPLEGNDSADADMIRLMIVAARTDDNRNKSPDQLAALILNQCMEHIENK